MTILHGAPLTARHRARRKANAGMPPEQAEAVAEAINDEVDGDLVTKTTWTPGGRL